MNVPEETGKQAIEIPAEVESQSTEVEKAKENTEEGFRLNRQHFIYLTLMNGIGPAILNFGVNFGLATAMYRGSPNPPTVWTLPGSLAGDAFVTIMVQVTLTWIISGLLTRKDVEGKKVKAIQWTPQNVPTLIRFFFFQGDYDFIAAGPPSRLQRLALSVIRGVVFAGLSSIILWPLSIIYLLVAFGNNGVIPDWPTPQIYKGVQGAVVGLIITPIIAIFALIEGHRVMVEAMKRRSAIPTSASQLLKTESFLSNTSEAQFDKVVIDSASFPCIGAGSTLPRQKSHPLPKS